MQRKILLLIATISFLFQSAKCQTWDWGVKAGGTEDDRRYDFILDDQENVYVAGSFSGSASFGSFTLTSQGGTDMFIAKLDPNGAVIWAKGYGGTGNDLAQSIKLNSNGDPIILGRISETVVFGTTTVTSAGGLDIAVVDFDQNGDAVSVFTDGGVEDDYASYFGVDQTGNIYIYGSAVEGMEIAGNVIPSSFAVEFFVAKYDSLGNSIWFEMSEDSGLWGYNVIGGMDVDLQGNVYVFGQNIEAFNIAGLYISIGGLSECYLFKMDTDGNGLWFRKVLFGEDNYPGKLSVNSVGESVFTGRSDEDGPYFGNDINGNPVSLDGLDTDGGVQFLARYNTDGGLLWATQASAIGGGVFLTESGYSVTSGTGDSGKRLSMFDPDGQLVWANEFNPEVSGNYPSVYATEDLNILISQNFSNSINIDDLSFTSSGGTDYYLAKITPDMSCLINYVELGERFPCNPVTGYYEQEYTIYHNDGAIGSTWNFNGQTIEITSSPQTVLLTELIPDYSYVNIDLYVVENPDCNFFLERVYYTGGPCYIPCESPSDLQTTAIEETEVGFAWSALSIATSYEYRYREAGTSTWLEGSTTQTELTLTGLTPATNYEFQVKSNCGDPESDYSPVQYFTTLSDVVACEVGPTGFEIVNGTNMVTISWTEVEEAMGYQYRYRSNGKWTSGNIYTNSVTLSGLNPSTAYTFQVRAYCGNFSPINSFEFTTYSSLSATARLASGDETSGNPGLEDYIYPVPAKDRINLVLYNLSEQIDFSIFDSNGRKVYHGSGENSNSDIDISHLTKGIYLMTYERNGALIKKSFIKE